MDRKREERRDETCEVFTPQETVRMMLNKLPDEMFAPEKTFLDNSCGNGNMLVEVLMMKLEKAPKCQQVREIPLSEGNKLGHKIMLPYIKACVESLYGTDMMEDNVEECKKRILDIYMDYVEGTLGLGVLFTLDDLKKTLDDHIVCTKMEEWDYEKWCPVCEKLF